MDNPLLLVTYHSDGLRTYDGNGLSKSEAQPLVPLITFHRKTPAGIHHYVKIKLQYSRKQP